MMLAIALVPPVVAAYLLSGWLGAGPGAGRPPAFLRACLAVGWGLGVSSCVFFGWLVVVGDVGRGFLATDLALSTVLALVGAALGRGGTGVVERAPGLPGAIVVILEVALVASLATWLLLFAIFTVLSPHGGWDALMIWNLRARFLFLGDDWASAFHPSLIASHLDYPLLIPASVARCWAYLGRDSPSAPALVALTFTVAIVGLSVSAMSALRGRTQGLLAGLVLLATSKLFGLGREQFADIPLAYYLLASAVALTMSDRAPGGSARWAALAGMMTGFAAWTKNEGLLFLAALIAARLVVLVPTRGRGPCRREAGGFALGLAPIIAVVIYFKIRFAPTNDLLINQGLAAIWPRLADPSRYVMVGRAIGVELARLGGGAIAWLFVYRLLLGRAARRPGEIGPAFLGMLLTLLLAGYALVYIVTPLPLPWHLQYSLDRLIFHLWPLAVFAFFLAVATPEEALAGRPRNTERATALYSGSHP